MKRSITPAGFGLDLAVQAELAAFKAENIVLGKRAEKHRQAVENAHTTDADKAARKAQHDADRAQAAALAAAIRRKSFERTMEALGNKVI